MKAAMWRLFVLTLLAIACRSSQQSVDLLLTNGRVFTANPARPWAEAVAIRGNRIVAVGFSADLATMPATRRIDLHGRLVVPGINDAHLHEPWSVAAERIDLQSNASADDVLKAIGGAHGTWVNVQIPVTLVDDPRLTREALDAAAPTKAVALRNLAGHNSLLNTAALRAWNIGDTDPDPPGGWYGRANGKLNGWLYEHALWMKDRAATEGAPDAVIVAEMRRFATEAVRFGITSVQSMPAVHPDRVAPLVTQLGVPLRWRWIEIEMASVPDAPHWPTKYIADGTPIERDAALRDPYSDQPNTRGRMNFTDDQVRRAVELAAHGNQQLLFHAAGELPIEKFFAAMRAIAIDWPAKRVRVEHGDFIGEFLPDAKRFGVVVVQNPAHFTLAELVRARYGTGRLRNFQLFRSLIDAGVPIAIGSDGPLNPWLNIMFAEMHPNNPGEAITREQALIAYTRRSAYAEFAEREKGTIARGMLADIAVLSQDIFTVAASELPGTESLLTIIDGRVAYEKATRSSSTSR